MLPSSEINPVKFEDLSEKEGFEQKVHDSALVVLL